MKAMDTFQGHKVAKKRKFLATTVDNFKLEIFTRSISFKSG